MAIQDIPLEDVGDEEQVVPKVTLKEHKDDLMAAYWRATLSTIAGRAVIWSILEDRAGVLAPTFAGELTHLSAHREGRRSIGLEILEAVLTENEQSYIIMRSEARERDDRYTINQEA